MDISKTVLRYVDKEYRSIADYVREMVRGGRVRKDYILTLTEIQSFLSTLRNFLKKASCLEQVHADLKYGRVCKRWMYTENSDVRILTKLSPRVVVAYYGDRIKISYDDREVNIHGTEIEYTINMFRDKVVIHNVDEVLEKRSLILEALGKLKAILEHTERDFEMCIKEFRIRC